MVFSIIITLIIISIIVFMHEFGHFLLAKKNGIGVTEFSIGMGPRLFSKVRGNTRYSIKGIPFGGSCIMKGDDNGIPDPDMEADTSDDAFNNKSVWARISVIAAGPIFNFILAFILSVILIGLVGFDKPVIQSVMDGYPAQQAGMQAGDEIVKLNNKKIVIYRDISLYLDDHPGESVDVTYKRDGQIYNTTIVPKWDEENQKYYMGIMGSTSYRTKGNVLQTMKYSAYEVKYWIELTFKSLGMLFTGKASVNDLSGPVGIVDIVDTTVQETKSDGMFYVFLNMLNLSILISANLGVMNLLPIPALDGGRLIFLFIEAVRGKPVPRDKEGIVHIAGFVLLMALMVFVLFNDIRKLLV